MSNLRTRMFIPSRNQEMFITFCSMHTSNDLSISNQQTKKTEIPIEVYGVKFYEISLSWKN